MHRMSQINSSRPQQAANNTITPAREHFYQGFYEGYLLAWSQACDHYYEKCRKSNVLLELHTLKIELNHFLRNNEEDARRQRDV